MKTCPNCQAEIPKNYEICWKCNYDLISQRVIEREEHTEISESSDIDCLRCETPMEAKGKQRFHEGAQWGLFGELGHLFTNRESFEVYVCPNCSKVEFFAN